MLGRSGSKSYSLEPIYDPKKDSLTKKPATIDEDPDSPASSKDGVEEEPMSDYSKLMESSVARKRRHFSIGVICFTAFILVLSMSVVMTSAKPYLDLMDPDAGTEFLGIFIASQPLAQLFFSPILGFIGNKLGSIRIPAMVSIVVMAFGYAFYACVSAFPEPRRWYLFTARFIIGAAGGTSTLCYSYVASASTVKERTTALSILQMSKASALIVGPLIPAAFSFLGEGEDHPIGNTSLYLNIYTAPAWVAVLLSLLNVISFLPCIFTEYNIAKEEGDFLIARGLKKAKEDNGEEAKRLKPDKLALVVCIFVAASTQFHFNFIDSLATLLVMEHLGLSSTRAVVLVGIMFAAAGVWGIVMFGSVGPLSRRIGERVVMITGIVLAMIAILILYPYAGPPPPLKFINETHSSEESFSMWNFDRDDVSYEETELPSCYNASTALTNGAGCPVNKQPWCCDVPATHSAQMIVGFLLIFTGVPLGTMMANVIFSKILGPYPQGTWTGFYGAGIAIARIICPIIVTSLYAEYGMVATCGFMTTTMTIILVLVAIFYRRLIPYRHAES